MLNYIELSDLWQYQKAMPDCREKELLHKLLFEYSRYAECGTYEECEQRKEWMSYSIDDMRDMFTKLVKGMREEVEYIRSEYVPKPKPKKSGRKPKKDGEDGI